MTENIEALVWERIPKDYNNSNLNASVYKTFIHNAKDFEDQHRSYMALNRLLYSSAEDLPTDGVAQQQLAKRLTDALL